MVRPRSHVLHLIVCASAHSTDLTVLILDRSYDVVRRTGPDWWLLVSVVQSSTDLGNSVNWTLTSAMRSWARMDQLMWMGNCQRTKGLFVSFLFDSSMLQRFLNFHRATAIGLYFSILFYYELVLPGYCRICARQYDKWASTKPLVLQLHPLLRTTKISKWKIVDLTVKPIRVCT